MVAIGMTTDITRLLSGSVLTLQPTLSSVLIVVSCTSAQNFTLNLGSFWKVSILALWEGDRLLICSKILVSKVASWHLTIFVFDDMKYSKYLVKII